MKKIVSMILVIAMLSCLCINAFADTTKDAASKVIFDSRDSETLNFISNGTVKVTPANADATVVYYVTVAWESLDFTYTFGAGDIWDPELHSYGTSDSGKWSGTNADNNNTADITITNHSNTAVSALAAFATGNTATNKNVTATLSNNAQTTIATGEGRTFAEADFKTVTVTVAGVPSVTDSFDVGTVTVVITTT